MSSSKMGEQLAGEDEQLLDRWGSSYMMREYLTGRDEKLEDRRAAGR
jgi:hypothetical protein